MTRTITVTWGMYLDSYGFGRTGRSNTDVVHLVTYDLHNTVALCGVGLAATGGSFTSGNLCPKCAKAADLNTAADFSVDEEESRWVVSQKGGADA